MKTVYTLALIAIQVIAMGQTQGNQTKQANKALTPTIKRATSGGVTKETRSELLVKKINELNQQIKNLESIKEEVNKEINQFFANNIIPTISGVSSAANPDQLLKDAADLTLKANELREEARIAGEEMKKQLMASSQDFLEKALLKQIEASELTWLITKAKYDQNLEEINAILFNYSDKPYVCAKVNYLLSQSAYAMQMATEIREEAKDLVDNSAKLGNYGNAEENEFIALSKQEEALSYFSTPRYASVKNKF